jgi:cytidine deaminase
MISTATPPRGPELVFGLVGALGAQLTIAAKSLRDALATVGYSATELNLLDLVSGQPEWAVKPTAGADNEMHERMNCGNRCREKLERADALALFGVAAIRAKRAALTGDATRPARRTAYIIRSLKTPEEVSLSRTAYGQSCYIVAVYSPHENRKQSLAKKIAESYFGERSHFMGAAEDLIDRDMRESGESYGQNLRDAFWQADVFLDGTTLDTLNRSSLRFVEIVFGHPFRTPTREEVGMFQAYGAALRSSSAGRQVGAAITRDGDVISIGTNEVAKAFGGQYWEGETPDGRDHCRQDDSTQAMTRSLFADVLARLRAKGWLAENKSADLATMLAAARSEGVLDRMRASKDDPASLTERAPVLDIIEFMRAVHAEMAAIVNAAKNGIAVKDGQLYSTAFPCHECARHIVAAGIRIVYFIEPYPKSRVAELYDDSVAIDLDDRVRVPFRAFTGIAPRLYADVFQMPKRRNKQGGWLDWDTVRQESLPRRFEPVLGDREIEWVEILAATLKAKNITSVGEG